MFSKVVSQENTNKHKDDPEADADDEKKSNSDGGLKKVVQDMGIIGISKILISVSGIILLPVLTKILGPDGYGLWSLALVTISISVMVLRLGSPLAITRLFPGKDKLEIREDFYSLIILIILVTGSFSIILFSFPNILADAIFDSQVIIVRIVAVIIFVQCLDKVFLAVFRAFREMKKIATINVISKYSEVGLAISLVLLGHGLIGAIIAVLVVRGSLSIVLYSIIHYRLPFKKPDFSSVKEYISVGLPATPGAISHLVVDLSDRYVISFFLGATFVGYYTPGYSLGKIVPTFLGSMLAFVLLPSVSEYYENDNIPMVKNILNLSTKYFLLISIPSFIGIIIVGRPILALLTTPEIAREGYIILVLSSVVGILTGLYQIFKQTVFVKKRTKLITVFWGLAAGINLVANIIFVPMIGIVAAGLTTIISYLIVTTLIINFSFKELPISFDYDSIRKIILSSVAMGSIIMVFHKYIWFNPFFLIGFGVIIYGSVLYIIGGINKKEIQFLKKLYS